MSSSVLPKYYAIYVNIKKYDLGQGCNCNIRSEMQQLLESTISKFLFSLISVLPVTNQRRKRKKRRKRTGNWSYYTLNSF